jgi:hypothetical protein
MNLDHGGYDYQDVGDYLNLWHPHWLLITVYYQFDLTRKKLHKEMKKESYGRIM